MIEFNYQIHREKELLTHGYTKLIFLAGDNNPPLKPTLVLDRFHHMKLLKQAILVAIVTIP